MVVAPRFLHQTPVCQVALAALQAGCAVLPIRPDHSKQPAVSGWKQYQQRRPSVEEVEAWFRDPLLGLALVTGKVSRCLIALDFDDPRVFDAWLSLVQGDVTLRALYEFLASGYEERTPKGGRHILFRCPEVFAERRPGNQKLALRPVPPPQRFETLAETREEGGLIIIDPSRGRVHLSGKPYIRLRGGVSTIRTISAAQREQLYASVRVLDEVPKPVMAEPVPVPPPRAGSFPARVSVPGVRPGDLFLADPANTWESLLADWDISRPKLNGAGHPERYLRHPGKVGPGPSCTLNADGTDRLYCFSHSVGLPVGCYLNKLDFYVHWTCGGKFSEAVRTLARQGYTKRKGS